MKCLREIRTPTNAIIVACALAAGMLAVATHAGGGLGLNGTPYRAHLITRRTAFNIHASDSDAPAFSSPSTFYLVDPATGKQAAGLRVRKCTPDTATCVLSASLPAGIYELWMKSSGSGSTEPVLLSNCVNVRAPTLLSIEGDLTTVGTRILRGSYFGVSGLKVKINYTDTATGKVKQIPCKVRSLENGPDGIGELRFSSKPLPDGTPAATVDCLSAHGHATLARTRPAPRSVSDGGYRGRLVSWTKLSATSWSTLFDAIGKMSFHKTSGTFFAFLLSALVSANNMDETHPSVEAYQLVYLTRAPDEDAPQLVSGVLHIPCSPQGRTALPLISYGHHTTIGRLSSPSLNLLTFDNLFAQITAAHRTGAIVAIADGPGLGVNDGRQPFMNHGVTYAAVDMLRASRSFLDGQYSGTARWNGKTALIGYSSGGYAAAATAKTLQLECADEFPVTACASLAGPHSLSKVMRDTFATNSSYKAPFYLAMMLDGYDAVYHAETNILSIMNSVKPSVTTISGDTIADFNAQLEALTSDPSFPGRDMMSVVIDINSLMTKAMSDPDTYTSPHDILTEECLSLFAADAGVIHEKLAANDSFADWVPAMRFKMFHCLQDDMVPYENTAAADAAFLAQGASRECYQEPGYLDLRMLLAVLRVVYPRLADEVPVHVICMPFVFFEGLAWLDAELEK